MNKMLLLMSVAVLALGMANEPLAGVVDSGTCNSEETCLWKLDDNGQLTIYAKEGYSRVATDDYTDFQDPLTGDYTSNAPRNSGFERAQRITSVVIDDKISSIGQLAFEFNRNLKSAYMPSVENLGKGAFYYTDLTSVDMPKIASIGAYAFQGNANLTYVSMPEDVEIGKSAFSSVQRDFTQEGYPEIGKWYNLIDLNDCTVSEGRKTCGVCNGYVMSGRGCVTSAQCDSSENHYFTGSACAEIPSNGTEIICDTDSGYVSYNNKCWLELPFSKKHWTPAEVNQWLKDDDNTITITFKK